MVRGPFLVRQDVLDHRVLAKFLDRSPRRDQAVACTQEYGCGDVVTKVWNDNRRTVDNQVISMYRIDNNNNNNNKTNHTHTQKTHVVSDNPGPANAGSKPLISIL